MTSSIIKDGKVWCPLCEDHIELLKISAAAKMVKVSDKTIYRFIDEGSVYAPRIAGHNCGNCLIRPRKDEDL